MIKALISLKRKPFSWVQSVPNITPIGIYIIISMALFFGGLKFGTIFENRQSSSEFQSDLNVEQFKQTRTKDKSSVVTGNGALELFQDSIPTKAEKQIARPLYAWERNAVDALVLDGVPMIAIVLDDMGLDQRMSDMATKLKGPLTLSYMSYGKNLIQQTQVAISRGHELLLHLPMEPEGEMDPGPGALELHMSDIELRRLIFSALNRFPGFIGVNNHMGSRFTADEEKMWLILDALRPFGYLFLDSLTTPKTTALKLGKKMGVPVLLRDVFLDNTNSKDEVRLRLRQTENIAIETGSAVAIGHPRDTTIKMLAEWRRGIKSKGFQIVPLSAIARFRFKKAQNVMLVQ